MVEDFRARDRAKHRFLKAHQVALYTSNYGKEMGLPDGRGCGGWVEKGDGIKKYELVVTEWSWGVESVIL